MTKEERREYNREYQRKRRAEASQAKAREILENGSVIAVTETPPAPPKRKPGRPSKEEMARRAEALATVQPDAPVKKTRAESFGQENVKPGENSKYLRHALVGVNLPPIDIKDPAQVQNRIGEYFQYCIDNDMKPNMRGMANWLGVNTRTLTGWKRGDFGKTRWPVIEKAVGVLDELWQDYMYDGKVNPASGIFLGKNMFGYRDVQDVVLTPNNPLGEEKDPEEIAKKYKYLELDDGE